MRERTSPLRRFFKVLCLAVWMASGVAARLSAQTLIDSFDAAPITGTADPANPPWNEGINDVDDGNAELDVQQDAANWFGAGATNRILRVFDASNTAAVQLRTNTAGLTPFRSSAVFTLSFDFYEPAAVSGAPLIVRLGTGAADSAANTQFDTRLLDGQIVAGDGAIPAQAGSYTLDAAHKLSFVANNSAVTIPYGNGETLGSQKADVWIDGVRVLDDFALASPITAGTKLSAIRFLTLVAGPSQEIFLDNVTTYDGPVIDAGIGERVDLRTWRREGDLATALPGTWTVATDGSSVFQSVNASRPTYFVSPDQFENTTIRGRFQIDPGAGDDDFVGFVFGYLAPVAANGDAGARAEFLLLDWKKLAQAGAVPGFRLAKVSGTLASADTNELWTHTSSANCTITQLGAAPIAPSWVEGVTYNFELIYFSDRIVISLQGGDGPFATKQQLFDVRLANLPPGLFPPGGFPPGRIGFYNYSQSRVRYSSFSREGVPALFTDPLGGGTLPFGNVRVGTSATLPLTIRNSGGQGSTLTGSASPGSGEFFGPSPDAAFSLAQFGSTDKGYQYTPLARGADSLPVTVTSNAGNATITLAGTGVGPVFASNPASGGTLDFGRLPHIGTAVRTATITNPTPDIAADPNLTNLTLLTATISGADAGSFLVEGFTAGSVIAKGGNLPVTVRLNAVGSSGPKNATLTIATDAGAAPGASGSTFSFPLTGAVSPPPLINGFTFAGAPLTDGASVAGSGLLAVTATDEDGIARAEFFYRPAASVFTTALGTDNTPANGLTAAWIVENLSDGAFDLIARVYDTVGGFSEITRRVNLSLAVPAAPVILSPPDGAIVQPATVQVTGTAPAFPALRIYRNGERVFTGAAQSNGTFAVPVPLVDGQNLIYAESANLAGASAPSNPVLVTRMAVLPVLSVAFASPTVVEGASRNGTVGISSALALPLTISLTSSRATRLSVPESVTIPAGQTSVGFTAQALQNQSVELPVSVAVSASAAGFDGAGASLQILDDDQPAFTVALDRAAVSERDGSPALHGTITLDRTIAFPLRMIFTAAPEGNAILPPQVDIPANSLGAIFPIGVLNNAAIDGSRDVAIVAYLVDSSGANTVAQSAPATLTIHDDDGPALALEVDRTLLVEGANPAATATVTRSPVTGGAVFVTLASSDTGQMTAPVSVTIPAGQASISFPLQAVADGTTDGNQPATLTASASGFSPASKILTVTDLQKPDLFVDLIAPPTGVETDAWIDVRILLRNQGALDAQGPYTQRLYLSTDALPGDDILLTQANFAGRLTAGFSIEQSLRVKLPRTAGRFWLVAETDANRQLDEALEDNNTAVSATPLDIEPAYVTTLTIAPETVPSATPIPIAGTATLRAGGPAAFVLVNIHIAHGTVNRVISALTNSAGQYSTTFTPLPGDGGLFQFFATHPGTDTAPIQDSVKVYGLGSEPASLDLRLSENSSQPGIFTITNLTDLPLTGLQATVTGAPAGITFTPTLAASNLPGSGAVALNYTIATTGPLARTAFTVSLTSTEGAALQIPVAIAVVADTPQLVAEPAELVAGMLRGQQHISTFTIRNTGSAATGPVNLLLPPGAPWMRAATSLPVPPLAPGASVPMTIQLTPPADLPLQEYSGNLVATDGAIFLSIPYRFRALSDQMGQLIVRTEDEYTYYASGNPPLAGATVRVIDALTRLTVGTLVSDANGIADFGPLREGYYEIEATAGQHATYRATHLIQPGTPNNIQAFLSRETVSYTWTVVPIQIEDRYKVTIDTTFETVVPIPVVTVEPSVIDLAEITVDETVVNIKVTNHGLLAADNTQLAVPTHPLWEFTPAIDAIGVLPAKSSITVPMRIRRVIGGAPPPPAFGGPAPAPDPGPCHIATTVCWELICGKFKNTYCAVLAMPNARAGCGGDAPAPRGGGCTNCGGQIGPGSGSTGVGVTLVCNPDCYVLAALGCIPGPVGCFFSGYSCGQGLAGGVSFGSVFDCAVGAAGCLIPAASIPACIYDLTKCVIGTLGGGPPPPPADGSQALGADPLSQFTPGLRAMMDVFNEITGAPDGVWLNPSAGSPTGDWYARFQLAAGESSDGGRNVTAAERAALLSGAQPPGVAAAEVNRFLDRCNRSLVNFARGILRRADAPAGESLDFIDLTELQRLLRLAGDYQTIAENAGFTDPINAIVETVRIRQNLGGSGGICGRIKLRLEQDAVLTRDAFLATLELENKTATALGNIRVNVTVRAESGADATALFDIGTPTLAGVTAVDGTGTLAGNSNGTAKWTIIPTVDAAPTAPVRFFVSGTLSYRVDGLDIAIPFSEIAITVLPSPRLALKYFHQRDVFSDDPFTTPIEPAIPYVLAVMVENQGFGAAKNFTITSAQPTIIENDKGLLADFQIIATKVDGQPLQPSLTANFGDIAPGQIRIGEWLLTSSLQGLFTDYSATFQHIDGRGNPRLSLIDSVEIHEMIHEVRELGLLDDGKPDFLVNDLGDARNLPDTIHLSDGTTASVAVLEVAQVTGTLSSANLTIGLTAAMPAGWAYLLVPEPSNGQYVLQRVVRSDGLEIPLDVNAWVTDRTFIGQGLRPVYENILHLLDENSPGNYTLIYALAAGLDTQAPVSRVLPLPLQSAIEFPISWEGTDDRRVAGFDVYVSVNGSAYARWLQGTRDTGAVYAGALGSSYAFYTRAFDAAGNVEAAPASADATTTVTLNNIAPTLATIPDQNVNEGETLTLNLAATDPDGRADLLRYAFAAAVPPGLTIDAQTGVVRWATGEADGGRAETVQVRVTDSGVPAQSATRTFLVRVLDTNQPPVFAPVEPQRIAPGGPLTVQLSASDGDLPAQTIRYRFTSPTPAMMMLDVVTGAIIWTPAIADADRTFAVAVTAADNAAPALETTTLVSITVDPANLDRAPQFLANPAQLWFIGTVRTLEIGAFDPDGDAVTMALNGPGLPAGLALSGTPGTGRAVLSWNTAGLAPGIYALPIRANAGAAQSLYAPTVKLVNDNAYWRWADANLSSLFDLASADPTQDPDGDGTSNVHEWTFLRDPRIQDSTRTRLALDGPYDGAFYYADISVHRRRGSNQFVTLIPQSSATLVGGSWTDLPSTDYDAVLDPNGDDDGNPETEEVSIRVLFQLTLGGADDRKFFRLKSATRTTLP